MKHIKSVFVLFIACCLFMPACKKKTREEDNDTDSATENFLAASLGNDMGSIADEAGRTKNIGSFKSSGANRLLLAAPCASLSFDTVANSNPDTIIVNFGNSNCLCGDGRYRRGSLQVVYSGKYQDSLTEILILPQNYFVNNHGVTGQRKMKNSGHNSRGHLIYDINESITINKPGGGSIVYFGIRQREWIQGENTLNWADDKFLLTGTATGYNSNGRSYTSRISAPLLKEMSAACRRYFVSGTIVHSPDGKPDRIIDFGNGACDNLATVTINDKVYEIELP